MKGFLGVPVSHRDVRTLNVSQLCHLALLSPVLCVRLCVRPPSAILFVVRVLEVYKGHVVTRVRKEIRCVYTCWSMCVCCVYVNPHNILSSL